MKPVATWKHYSSMRRAYLSSAIVAYATVAGCSGDSENTKASEVPFDQPPPIETEIVRDISAIAGVWEFQPYDREVPSTDRQLTDILITRVGLDGEVTQYRPGRQENEEPCFNVFFNVAQIKASADGELIWDEPENSDDAQLRLAGQDMVVLYSGRTEVYEPSDDYSEEELETFCPLEGFENAIPLQGPQDLIGVWSIIENPSDNFDLALRSQLTLIDDNYIGRRVLYRASDQQSPNDCYYEDTSSNIVFEQIEDNQFNIFEFGENYRTLLFFTEDRQRILFSGGRRRANVPQRFFNTGLAPGDITPLCPLRREITRNNAVPVNDTQQVQGIWRLESMPPIFEPVGGPKYLLLREDASFTRYEGFGGLQDGSENCFDILAEGFFEVEEGNRFIRRVAGQADLRTEWFLDGDDLHLIYTNRDEDFDERYSLQNLGEGDLRPLCPQG